MAKNGHPPALPCRAARRVRPGAPAAARHLTSSGPIGMVPASMRFSRSWRVLMALVCLSLATAVRAADDSVPSLAASARAECDAGRRATDREARKEHFDRGQALAERAVALDDNSADAHFALFCNLGELMRLDGENLSQIFQLRRLMAEVDRTLELNPNHVDAMAAKGTLLVRLPRLLGGDSARGEAMLREVLARDPNAFTTRLALANVCEARRARPERLDWAAGTSSRSSKLIHGGVRYLEQGDVGLVREAAMERSVLRRLAPHLALPVRLVMPTYGRAGHAKLGLGLWTFERIATVAPEERHAMWSREEALAREPTLDGTRLHGAATFVEYLTCDARLVLETVLGAHAAGALCVSHVEATEIAGGEVALRDTLTGRALHARSAVVVNAAGPWVDEVRRRAGTLAGVRLHLTRGIHLVVPHARLPVRHIVVMQARDRRSAFAVPLGPV